MNISQSDSKDTQVRKRMYVFVSNWLYRARSGRTEEEKQAYIAAQSDLLDALCESGVMTVSAARSIASEVESMVDGDFEKPENWIE